MAKTKITDDSIKKAYATLGLTDTETIDTIEKASDSTIFKKFKKGDSSYFRKFNKAEDGSMKEDDEKKKFKAVEKGYEAMDDEDKVKKADKEDEEDIIMKKKAIKKADKDEDEDEDKDEKMKKAGKDEDDEEEVKKADDEDEDDVKKADDEDEEEVEKADDDEDEDKDEKMKKAGMKTKKNPFKKAQSTDIEKAITGLTQSNAELFKSVGIVLKDIKEKQENFQKSITEQLETIQSNPNNKKSITKAIAVEKFGKNEENGTTVLSASKHKKALLDVLERVSFAKGFDNEFANAMTRYESSGEISRGTINRLMQEHKIQIIQ